MKRILLVLFSFGLLAASIGPVEAAKGKRIERTVHGQYGAYPAPVTGCNEPLGPWSCLSVKTRPSESYFAASVTDTHGQPVAVDVYTRLGSGHFRYLTSFCGKTTRPIAFTRGWSLHFEVGMTSGTPVPCVMNRVKTTGKIRVTLANQP